MSLNRKAELSREAHMQAEYDDTAEYDLFEDEWKQPWEITDLDSASWAARTLQTAMNEITDIDAWEKREIARVKAAANRQRRRPEVTKAFFLERFREYLEKEEKKTLELPAGKVTKRARQPMVEVMRTGDALDWIEGNNYDALLRIKKELNKTAFKKYVKLEGGGKVLDPNTGEVLDFARWEEQDDSMNFTPTEE